VVAAARWWPVLLCGGLFGVLRGARLADSDVLWEIRTGLDAVAHHALPHTDPYSWTAAGSAWVPNSWGWDVLLAGVWRCGGFAAIGVFTAVLVTVLFCGIGHRAARAGAAPLAVAATLAGAVAAFAPWVTARPQTAGFLLLIPLLALIDRATGPGRFAGRQLTVLTAEVAAVSVLWVNLHFSAVLAPVLLFAAGVFAAAAARRTRERGAARRILSRSGLLAVVSAGCCCVTPYGPAAFTKAAQVRDASTGLILEWLPPGLGSYAQVTGLLAFVAAAAALWVAARSGRWATVGVLFTLAAATGMACRFAPLLLVAALPQVAVLVTRAVRRDRAARWLRRTLAGVSGVSCVVALFGAGQFGSATDMLAAPTLLARIPHGCRVLNDYNIGGALLLLRPDVQVSVESRNDVYGRAGVQANKHSLAEVPGTGAYLDRSGVRCVLAGTASPLVRALRGAEHWRVAGKDSVRTLLVRR